MTPEGKVKKEVKKILDMFGAYYFMPVQTGYGRMGIPDFIVCYRGLFLAIETKAGDNEPTILQAKEIAAIKKAEGVAVVINETNLGQLVECMEYLRDHKTIVYDI